MYHIITYRRFSGLTYWDDHPQRVSYMGLFMALLLVYMYKFIVLELSRNRVLATAVQAASYSNSLVVVKVK